MKTHIKSNAVKTILIISVGLVFVYLVTKWKWIIYISLIIGLIGIFSSYLSKKIDFLWMKLTWILSLIVPNIILCIVFYLLLFPLSILSKIFSKKDQLHLKNNCDSVFISINKDFDKGSFEKPW
jgi:hypothetical protein